MHLDFEISEANAEVLSFSLCFPIFVWLGEVERDFFSLSLLSIHNIDDCVIVSKLSNLWHSIFLKTQTHWLVKCIISLYFLYIFLVIYTKIKNKILEIHLDRKKTAFLGLYAPYFFSSSFFFVIQFYYFVSNFNEKRKIEQNFTKTKTKNLCWIEWCIHWLRIFSSFFFFS